MTMPTDMIPEYLLRRLPAHLIHPNPNIYLTSNFLTLDLETNIKGDGGSPLACWPQNSIVCASWSHSTNGEVYNIYGNELEMEPLLQAIAAADFIVGHNLKFDIGWLKRAGLELHDVLMYDTMIGEFVINGNRTLPLSLDVLAKKYLGYGKQHFVNMCMKAGIDAEDIPKSKLITRCNSDVIQTRDVFLKQRKVLRKNNLLGCTYTRCLLSPALADMESFGMCLDGAAVTELYTERATKLAETVAEIDEFTGGINPRSPIQVREFVYDTLKFKPKMKGKTPIYSTKSDDLLALKSTNNKQRKFVELKKKWSGFNADVTKNLLFFQGVVQDKNPNGDIFYASFNQCIAKTHRLSSSGIKRTFTTMTDDKGKHLNKSVQFQNFKREFKKIMRPRNKGWSMGESDGAQLEFRVAGFLGRCPVVTQEVIDGVDVHCQSGAIINDIPIEEFLKRKREHDPIILEMRQQSKADTFKPLTYRGI